MSSLKDIQYAINGEPKEMETPQKEYRPQSFMMATPPKESKDFVLFKLCKSNRNGGITLPCIDYVIDPRTITNEKPNGNGPEMIRLLEGVPTIWVKEQKDLSQDYIKKNTRSIKFVRGSRFMRIPSWDVTYLEFIRICRYNIGSKFRTKGSKFEFFEYDPNEVAKDRLKAEMLEMEMVAKAANEPFESMQKHAFYLRIQLVNELGKAKAEDELRPEYMLAAKRNPAAFKESYGSQKVDVNYKVREAIISGKIDISKGDNKAYWGKGGALIGAYPKNEKAIDFLTNLALQKNQQGTEFLEQLNYTIT